MKIAYILGSFPSVSETFILREILALKERGIDVVLFALRRPDSGKVHADALPLTRDVCYRPSLLSPASIMAQLYFLFRSPLRYAKCAAMVKLAYVTQPVVLLKAVRNFFAAAFFARKAIEQNLELVHAQFAFIPADVAMVMGELMRKPYSVSAHAWDIYTQGRRALEAKICRASFVVTCTGRGCSHLKSLFPGIPAEHFSTVYHGVLPKSFAPGSGDEKLILGAGRLEGKKGFRYLVEACDVLGKRGTPVRCVIAGSGPSEGELRGSIDRAELGDSVTLTGDLSQKEMLELYRRASVFVLPSVVTLSGDRDGLANVILEAMAMELPVVSTTAAAADEAVEDGVTGYLVGPGDAEGLADRIGELLGDDELRGKMGREARQRVVDRFDVSANVDGLVKLFQSCVSGSENTAS